MSIMAIGELRNRIRLLLFDSPGYRKSTVNNLKISSKVKI